MERPPPPWLTPLVIAGAVARYRALIGRWKAMPFGEAMVLDWPGPCEAD
jgi:hypothetical protein